MQVRSSWWRRWLPGRREYCPGPRLPRTRGPIAVQGPGRHLSPQERELLERVGCQIYGLERQLMERVPVRLAEDIHGRQGQRVAGMVDLSRDLPAVFLREESRSDALLLLDEVGHIWLWSRRARQSHAVIYGCLKSRFESSVDRLFRELGYTWRSRLWLWRQIRRRARRAERFGN